MGESLVSSRIGNLGVRPCDSTDLTTLVAVAIQGLHADRGGNSISVSLVSTILHSYNAEVFYVLSVCSVCFFLIFLTQKCWL